MVQRQDGAILALKTNQDGSDMSEELLYLHMCTGAHNIVQLSWTSTEQLRLGVVSINSCVSGILMEAVDGVPLHEAVRLPAWHTEIRKPAVLSLATAVLELHNRDLVHGDLHTGNFLVSTSSFEATLIDLWKTQLAQKGMHVYCTGGWRAPEVSNGRARIHGKNAFALDVWALSVTFCCMLVNVTRLREYNREEVMS
eukprot:3937896-Rhodomonas_salina.1